MYIPVTQRNGWLLGLPLTRHVPTCSIAAPHQAFAFANICFFCGMPIAWGLDLLGDWVMSREGASMLNGGRGAVSASQQHHPDPESSSSSMGSPVLSGSTIVVEVPPPPTTAALAAEEAGGGNAAAVGSAEEQKAAAESELKSAARLLKVGVLAALAVRWRWRAMAGVPVCPMELWCTVRCSRRNEKPWVEMCWCPFLLHSRYGRASSLELCMKRSVSPAYVRCVPSWAVQH